MRLSRGRLLRRKLLGRRGDVKVAEAGPAEASACDEAERTLRGPAVAGKGVNSRSGMNIGEPRRTYTVEPLEDPVPRKLPERLPEREEPAEPPREPEKVPA